MSEPEPRRQRILVIKLGALGDFILNFDAFAAIRRHHAGAEITLLTTAPFAPLGEASPWFDRVAIDRRPRWTELGDWVRRRRWLRGSRFTRVYDLQTSSRSAWLYRLFWPGPWPEWSGIANGASHPDRSPDRAKVHAATLRQTQLAQAGVAVPDGAADAELGWLDASLDGLLPTQAVVPGQAGTSHQIVPPAMGLDRRADARAKPEHDGETSPIALLCPGSAPHRPDKRWPHFPELAVRLAAQGLTPVVLGTKGEADLARAILAAAPSAIDLTGRTSLFQIAALARRARLSVGNDTGPMHLIARLGCPSLVLFGPASNPVKAAPLGRSVRVIQAEALTALSVDDVLSGLQQL